MRGINFMQDNNNDEDKSDLSTWVYRNQIDLLYAGLPFSIISTAVVVLLVFIFVGDSLNWLNSSVWFLLFVLVLVLRSVSSWLFYRQKSQHQVAYRRMEQLFIVGVVFTGMLWASVGLLLFPEVDLKGKVLLFIVIMGTAAAANTTMGYRRVPIYIFTALLILPLVVGVNIADFPNAIAVSIAMLVYMVFLLRTSIVFYSNNEKMLKLQEASLKHEQKLLIQREKAELANRSKSEFLSRMSHELRTPLNTVLGLNELQLLDKHNPLTQKQLNRAHKISDAGHHLLSLVNDVLDFSRIETGEIEINVSVINCMEVLRDALKLIEAKLAGRRITVFIDDGQHDIYVQADYTRLKQVLVNLLDNAVKYNRNEGTITVTFEDVGKGYIRISVVDTGYGIPDHLKGELFTPFSRLNAEQMGIDGTGIGLSFSKQLVELMKGQIGVESRQGQGSCFWIELAKANEPVSDIEQSTPASLVTDHIQNTSLADIGKLLLAEDNLVNQEVAVDMLEQAGYELDVANTGEEALTALSKARYALVLMDCEMPVMDGFTATRQLREREKLMELPATPVIALTAHAIEGVRERCLACGMNDFLTKPFSYAEITGKVARWIERGSESAKRQQDALASKESAVAMEDSEQQQIQITGGQVEVSVLEPHALNQLRARQTYRNKNLVKRVVGLYLEQTPKLLKELESAGQQADTEALSHIAHTIKSSSMTVGATALAESCKEIELLCNQGWVGQEVIRKPGQMYFAVEQELQHVLANEI